MTDNKDIIRSIRVHLSEVRGCGGCTYYKYFPEATCFLHMISDAADALEADGRRIAELMPKEGEWIEQDDGNSIYHKCSVCGKNQYNVLLEMMQGDYHYCPNCGAKMKGDKQ